MAIAWYIVPYKRDERFERPTRYCAVDDFTPLIYGEGGQWAETEALGNVAVVKVRASVTTLAALTAEFVRLPKDRLGDSLADLSPSARAALRDKLIEMGYSAEEIRERLGEDLAQKTLGDVLRFAASRRRKPRWDAETDTIMLDGPEQPCRSVGSVDAEVEDR